MSHIGEKDWVPVTEPMYLNEADVICAMLEEAGIPVKQAEPNGQRYSNFAPQLNTAEVLVPKQHLEQDRTLLDAKEKEAGRGVRGA